MIPRPPIPTPTDTLCPSPTPARPLADRPVPERQAAELLAETAPQAQPEDAAQAARRVGQQPQGCRPDDLLGAVNRDHRRLGLGQVDPDQRSDEHTSEIQPLMRI